MIFFIVIRVLLLSSVSDPYHFDADPDPDPDPDSDTDPDPR